MTNRILVLAYLPPPRSIPYAASFLESLRRFHPHDELVLYSDHDWPGEDIIKIKDPEAFRIKKVPMGGEPTPNPWSVNNAIFFTALRIAQHRGATHVIYCEADCRFGRPAWDKAISDEFFSRGGYAAACGGTMVCYAPCNHSLEASEKWRSIIAKNERRNFPIATYGAGGAATKQDPCCFVNGALGIYSMEWMEKLFCLDNTEQLAKSSTAWDYEIGLRLWRHVGLAAYDHVIHLDCIYSGYGDKIVSEADRIRMLEEGRVVAVHQVKSNYVGPPTPVLEPETVEEVSVPIVDVPVQGDRRVEIFCVTFGRDAEWLALMLRSVRRFCAGFSGVTVLVPRVDRMKFLKKCSTYGAKLVVYDEVPDKGFNDHQAQICMADVWCPDATHIMHVDADCIFTRPTTPDDYFVGWKPVLLRESFDRIKATGSQPGRLLWQAAAQTTLGITVPFEMMCRHPAVHWKSLYGSVRDRVQKIHGKSLRDHFLEGQNTFPQSVAEFPTLGAWAFEIMLTQYHWIEVGADKVPEDHLKQYWSYVGISPDTKAEIEAILK